MISLQFFSNCSSSFSHLYGFKLIKHVVSVYLMNHDVNQWSEIWKTTSECSLKTKSKIKIKISKLLYKPKSTVMIAKLGDIPILTVSRGVVTNDISFCISGKRR